MFKNYKLILLGLIIISCFSVVAIEDDCIYYFYGNECPECKQSSNHLDSLKVRYPSVEIKEFEVHYNLDNSDILSNYFESYNIPEESRKVPIVILSGSYFIGNSAIESLLESRMKDNLDSNCPTPKDKVLVGVVGKGVSFNVLELISIEKITGSGLLKSFSVGMIAIWLLMVMLLIVLRERRALRKKGFLIVLGVFLASILFASGVLPKVEGIYGLFYKVIGLIAVIYGFIGIIRFFKPELLKFTEGNMKNIQKLRGYLFNSYVLLVIGFAVGYLSTGIVSPTLFLLRTLTEKFPLTLVQYNFFYSFILILPLLIILIVIGLVNEKLHTHAHSRGKKSEKKIEEWKNYNLKILSLVISCILLFAGMILLLV